MFELHQIRCFVAVATEMNFHRAAERLNMTQPPVSRQVQILERQLGVELFDRKGRAIQLTPSGERFLIEARELLKRAEDARYIARAIASGHLGNVSIGAVPAAILPLFPRILTTLSETLPEIRVLLHEMLILPQVAALNSGQIDIGIMRKHDGNLQCCKCLLYSEPFVLAVPISHPFADRTELSISDLDEQDFLMYSPDGGWYGYELLTTLFASESIRPHYVQHVAQSLSMLSMVDVGYGVALVPDSVRRISFENVVYKAIAMPDSIRSEYYAILGNERKDDPSVLRTYETICDTFIDPESRTTQHSGP